MKKNMIRWMLVAMLTANMVACGGKTAKCDFCGQEKVCETKQVLGENINICKDCMKSLSTGK
ncbi:MAG: hypothetical protein LUC99_06270 [Clostridiales bacterium]|nr:hypothetical protein [Clostridiales bacterium]